MGPAGRSAWASGFQTCTRFPPRSSANAQLSPPLTAAKSSSNALSKIWILQPVNHICIINLEDVINTPNFLFIVLKLAEGGELFDKIIKKTKLNEADAKLRFFLIP